MYFNLQGTINHYGRPGRSVGCALVIVVNYETKYLLEFYIVFRTFETKDFGFSLTVQITLLGL